MWTGPEEGGGGGDGRIEERTDGRRIDWRDQSHCEIDSKDDEEEKPSARARTT
jgi:hypothetical protein